MGWVRRGVGRWRKKRKIYWRGRGWKKRRSSAKQKTENERKTGEIADFNFLPLLRGNKLWLSNQLQPLCHKSSHMRGTMTHSSLRSLSFLHAFLFRGVLMNDLKSDLFPRLGCLGGRGARRGGAWTGWAGLRVKASCLRREHRPHHTSSIYFIHEREGGSIQVQSGFSHETE